MPAECWKYVGDGKMSAWHCGEVLSKAWITSFHAMKRCTRRRRGYRCGEIL